MTKKLLYFLCTGNSCRSQIAEAFGKLHLGEDWDVKSAGIEAHGLNPQAVETMANIGIDITGQTSDIIDQGTLEHADFIVTLCADADANCPVTPRHVRREHWGFDDPAKATGADEEIRAEFERVRDEIRERIMRFKDTGK